MRVEETINGKVTLKMIYQLPSDVQVAIAQYGFGALLVDKLYFCYAVVNRQGGTEVVVSTSVPDVIMHWSVDRYEITKVLKEVLK